MTTPLASKFQKATRAKARLKITITGPSGSGKTLGALLLAKGIGGRIAVIDSENDSASLYADRPGVPEFSTLNLSAPYTTKKYLDAINDALNEKFDIIIVDSGTHQWAGEGGVLARKEQLDQKPGSNSYTNWGKMTPEQEQFKNAILFSPVHMIMTMRSKQEYAMSRDEKTGKNKVEKLGMAPIQKEGLEYEFTTVFDVDMTHNASTSKDRTGLFDQFYDKLSEATGKKMLDWLSTGKDRAASREPEAPVAGSDSSATGGTPPTEPPPPRLNPDTHITSGSLEGKEIATLDPKVAETWLKNVEEHMKIKGIDPGSFLGIARSFRAVKAKFGKPAVTGSSSSDAPEVPPVDPSEFEKFNGTVHEKDDKAL